VPEKDFRPTALREVIKDCRAFVHAYEPLAEERVAMTANLATAALEAMTELARLLTEGIEKFS